MREPPISDASPKSLSIRLRLLAEAATFTCHASHLSGVTRIALIGSLITPKPDPKDADLLVTVTDDADLAPLAAPGPQACWVRTAFRSWGAMSFSPIRMAPTWAVPATGKGRYHMM